MTNSTFDMPLEQYKTFCELHKISSETQCKSANDFQRLRTTIINNAHQFIKSNFHPSNIETMQKEIDQIRMFFILNLNNLDQEEIYKRDFIFTVFMREIIHLLKEHFNYIYQLIDEIPEDQLESANIIESGNKTEDLKKAEFAKTTQIKYDIIEIDDKTQPSTSRVKCNIKLSENNNRILEFANNKSVTLSESEYKKLNLQPSDGQVELSRQHLINIAATTGYAHDNSLSIAKQAAFNTLKRKNGNVFTSYEFKQNALRDFSIVQFSKNLLATQDLVTKFSKNPELTRSTTSWESISIWIDQLIASIKTGENKFNYKALTTVNMFASANKKVDMSIEEIKQGIAPQRTIS